MAQVGKVFTDRRDEKVYLMVSFFFLLHLIIFFSDSSFQNRNFLNRLRNKRQDLLFCFLVHFSCANSLAFVPCASIINEESYENIV
jgi:hypothetical protein